jgi:tartrate-resistant acid phosphatase type 5
MDTEMPLGVRAVGDLGRGGANQRLVGAGMAKYADAHPVSAVLMAGDLFYVKLTSATDPLFESTFEKPYDFKSLKVPFYAVPGNHDYQEGKLALELAYASSGKTRFTMPRNYYRIDLPDEKHPDVTLLMLDSNKPLMGESAWAEEESWLETQLKEVSGKHWVVTVAHHPLYSNGNHGDVGPLQATWGTLFSKYKVDLVIAGHDHDLQHLEVPFVDAATGKTADSFPSYLLVGGGGASTRAMRRDNRGPFSKRSLGFAALEFTPKELKATLYTPDLVDLHTFTRTRKGKVEIVSTTPSDKATPRTPASINRDDKVKDKD